MIQRDKMRQLFQVHGEAGMEEILRQYTQAELSGEVTRKKKGRLTADEYAVRLYNDGIKKGWIRESVANPRSKTPAIRNSDRERTLQEYGTTTSAKQIPTCELTVKQLPSDHAAWPAILRFAYSFDGYDFWSGFEKCSKIGNSVRDKYSESGELPSSINELRTALFFQGSTVSRFTR